MKFTPYDTTTLKSTPHWTNLPDPEKENFEILTRCYPFKANNFVLENLIDWEDIPNDPMYKLIFPRKEMLSEVHYNMLLEMHRAAMDEEFMTKMVDTIKRSMHPDMRHTDHSMPKHNGKWIKGLYSNFGTIVSLFPDPMLKTCHSYCSYCFRWNAFGNTAAQKGTTYNDPQTPVAYLRAHPEITDVLFTGADPLVLKADVIRKYVEPILEIASVQVIRISSKSLAWWPFRFTTDKDADELLRLFEDIQARGKHFNFCAHFTHPRELAHPEVARAVQRIRATGAVIRTQGPIVAGINDNAEAWRDLWTKQIAMGMVPYYMFIEADHNPESCFRIPLADALRIFQDAQRQCSGLARTVRGPVFMNDINRVLLDGTTELNGEKYFVLKSLQAPPGLQSEGAIKLVPYNEITKGAGDLFNLFNPEEGALV